MVLMVMTQGIDRDFCRLAALSSGTGRPSRRHSTQCAAAAGPTPAPAGGSRVPGASFTSNGIQPCHWALRGMFSLCQVAASAAAMYGVAIALLSAVGS